MLLRALPAPAASISGRISYYTSGAPVPDVTVVLTGPSMQTTQTDSNGQYSFTSLTSANWQVTASKSGGLEEAVSSLDAGQALSHALGEINFSPVQLLACDVDRDGAVASADADDILALRVGNLSALQTANDCGSEFLFIANPSPASNQSTMALSLSPTCQQGAISYQPLVGDPATQNFVAIAIGDCSGNWPSGPAPATITPTATRTNTAGVTGTATRTPTRTPTWTVTRTPTRTPTFTATRTPTRTPTVTRTSTPTASPTRTTTRTPSFTPSRTPSSSPTITPTQAFAWPTLATVAPISGFSEPVHLTHAGDGSGRIFVVEKGGLIRIIRNGAIVSTPFLNIADRVSMGSEQGLLSVAFPPDFASKDYFYVNYTDLGGDTVVARFHLAAGNDDLADPGSEEPILGVEQPYDNHNGGQIAFGADGYLYIGMGDGGSAGDPQNHAQNPDDLLGKMLRIDVEGGSAPYGIPPTNPNVGNSHPDEIWSLGLRNPWRFSFDRQTGDLYIGDVGQGTREEVDFEAAGSSGGLNYGWRLMEGIACFNPSNCDPTGLTLPVVDYTHALGCSITGGVIYRGATLARMQGVYFYGDLCSGRIWGLKRSNGNWYSTLMLDTDLSITSFGEDEAGNAYVVNFNGNIFRLTDTSGTP